MRAEAGVGSVRKGRKSRVRRDPLALVRKRWRIVGAVFGVILVAALATAVA